jgi:hypothetical protein
VDLPTLGRPTMATSGNCELAGVLGTTDLWYFDTKKLQSPVVCARQAAELRGIDYPYSSIVS